MNIEVEILASETGVRSTRMLCAQSPIVIGRAPECSLPLEHELVSRKHAVVSVAHDLLRVEDTSRNGTLAGGLVLRRTVTEIPWGAPIGIAQYELTFRRKAQGDGESLSERPTPPLQTLATLLSSADTGPVETLDDLLAPLQPYLDDQNVSQVLINGRNAIYVEREGRLELAAEKFEDAAAMSRLLRLVARLGGQRLDEQHPILQARLPGGHALYAVTQPAARGGPYVAIRRDASQALDSERLIELGSLSRFALDTLRALIAARQNLLISGGPDSGKTVLLWALARHVPEAERVGVIEHADEMPLEHPHAFYLSSRSADARSLFRASLRLRPDRLVIGEIRGPEALDIVEALVGGSGGCLSTLPSPSPRDALARLEAMALNLEPGLSLPALRLRIGAAVNFVVQTARLADGSRKVTHLTEVQGYDVAAGRYRLQDIFARKYSGSDAAGRIQSELVPTALPGWVEAS